MAYATTFPMTDAGYVPALHASVALGDATLPVAHEGMRELDEHELDAVNGAFAPLAIYAVRIGGGAVVGGIAGGVASSINGDFSWRAVGAGAAAGAIGGAFGGWMKVKGF
jgi:lactobin A/cerein 7B family class IIb bacteriocin